MDTDAGMIVGDLPSGSIFSFVSNLFISSFFQFIGFLLTYLMHTTHAAKFGSRAGLGLTLIQYGFYSRATKGNILSLPEGDGAIDDPSLPTQPSYSAPMPQDDNVALSMPSRDWISFLLMTVGTLHTHSLSPSFPLIYSTVQVGSYYSTLSSISGE